MATDQEETTGFYNCPVCKEWDNPVLPCRSRPGRETSYTFHCPGCGTRAFLKESGYQYLLDKEEIHEK